MIVLFDLDDTLMDHSTAVRVAVESLHERLSLDVSKENLLEAWRAAHVRHYPRYLQGELAYDVLRRKRIQEAISPDIGDAEADSIFRCYMDSYEAAWSLFPDTVPCLNELRDHILGLVSNGRSEEQRLKLTRLEIGDRFQYVTISEECGYAKPDPRIFRHACRVAGVTPSEALYVGDHYEIDVTGATRAGLRGVWLDRSGEADKSADSSIVHLLTELKNLLSGG